MSAMRSASSVARNTPCMEQAKEPPTAYRIPSDSRVVVNSFRASGKRSITGELVWVGPLEKLRSEPALGAQKKDLAFRCVGMSTPNACLGKGTHKCREFKGALQPLVWRHLPYQANEHLPCFGRRIARPHTYIIAAGGAGSFGS